MCTALFGRGRVETPKIEKVAPAATTVTAGDIGGDTNADMEAAKRRKKKQGFAATRLADNAITQSGIKSTLG